MTTPSGPGLWAPVCEARFAKGALPGPFRPGEKSRRGRPGGGGGKTAARGDRVGVPHGFWPPMTLCHIFFTPGEPRHA